MERAVKLFTPLLTVRRTKLGQDRRRAWRPHRQRRELVGQLVSPLLPQANLVMRVGNPGGLLLLRRNSRERNSEEGLPTWTETHAEGA